MEQENKSGEIQALSQKYLRGEIDRETFYTCMLEYERYCILSVQSLEIMEAMQTSGISDGLEDVFPDALNRAIDTFEKSGKVTFFSCIPAAHYFTLNDLINRKIQRLCIEYNEKLISKSELFRKVSLYMFAEKKGYRPAVKSRSVIATLRMLRVPEADIEACYDNTIYKCIEKCDEKKGYDVEQGVPFLVYFRDKHHYALCDLRRKVFSEGRPWLTVKAGPAVEVFEKADIEANVIDSLSEGNTRRVYDIRTEEKTQKQFYQIRTKNKMYGYVAQDNERISYHGRFDSEIQSPISPASVSNAAESLEKIMLVVYCTAFRGQNKSSVKPGTLSYNTCERQFGAEMVLDALHTDGNPTKRTFRHEQAVMKAIDMNWMQYLLSAPCKSFWDIIRTLRYGRNHFAEVARKMQTQLVDLEQADILQEWISYKNYHDTYEKDDTEVDLCWCKIAVRLPYLRNELQITRPFKGIKSSLSKYEAKYMMLLEESLKMERESLEQKLDEIRKVKQ